MAGDANPSNARCKVVQVDTGSGLVIVGYFIWWALRDIRDQLFAVRLRDDPSFFNLGWIRYRRLPGGTIEAIGSDGFISYKSEADFRKKTGRSMS